MELVKIESHSLGKRVYLLGQYRLHHGLFGAGVLLFGAFLMWHDKKDFKVWIKFSKQGD